MRLYQSFVEKGSRRRRYRPGAGWLYTGPALFHVGIAEFSKDQIVPPHRHDHYEIIFVSRGIYRCRLNDTPLVLSSGQWLFVKPGDVHEDQGRPGLHFMGLAYRFVLGGDKTASLVVLDAKVKAEEQVLRNPGSEVRRCLARLQKNLKKDDSLSDALARTVATELFWLLLKAFGLKNLSPLVRRFLGGDPFAQSLFRFFDENLSRQIDLKQMTVALKLSQSTLASRCRELTALSPGQAFLKYKTDCARTLLMDSALSIKDISEHLGFSDPFHFSKVFKKYQKKSPKFFRESPDF